MSEHQRCRSCDAEVVFVPSAATGKRMVLDASPRKGVVLIDGIRGADSLAAAVSVYTDHHATCLSRGEP